MGAAGQDGAGWESFLLAQSGGQSWEEEEEEDTDEVLGPRGRSVKDIEGGQERGQESCEGSSHLLSWNLSNEIIP